MVWTSQPFPIFACYQFYFLKKCVLIVSIINTQFFISKHLLRKIYTGRLNFWIWVFSLKFTDSKSKYHMNPQIHYIFFDTSSLSRGGKTRCLWIVSVRHKDETEGRWDLWTVTVTVEGKEHRLEHHTELGSHPGCAHFLWIPMSQMNDICISFAVAIVFIVMRIQWV